MSRKIFGKRVTFLIAVAVSLAGCSSSNEGIADQQVDVIAEPLSISVAYAGGDNAHKKGIQTIINDFKKSHLNVQIKDIHSRDEPYSDFLVTKDAVGEFPDLVEMRNTQMFVDAGLLSELPQELQYLFEDVPEVNGKVYNAPIAALPPNGIIYNKKLFRQLGIVTEPRTYQDFMDICQKLKQSGISPLIVGGKDIWHMGFWVNKFLLDYVYSQDTDWNSKRSVGQVSWTDAGPAEAMKELASLWHSGYVEPGFLNIGDNQTVSYLVSGKAAMLYSGPWMFKQIEEADPNFEIGFFALPDRKGTVHIFGLPQPAGWAISADAAKDPNKLKIIKQFLHFFYNPEEYPRYLEAVSGIPATKEAITYKTTEPMQKVLDIMNDPKSVKLKSMEHYWGKNQMPPAFRNTFYKLVQDYLSNKISLEEVLKKADQTWDKDVVLHK